MELQSESPIASTRNSEAVGFGHSLINLGRNLNGQLDTHKDMKPTFFFGSRDDTEWTGVRIKDGDVIGPQPERKRFAIFQMSEIYFLLRRRYRIYCLCKSYIKFFVTESENK